MSLKQYFKEMISSFFIIVTLINIAIFILGNLFRPEQRFGYEAFLAPIIYGLFSLIPFIVMYSKKELTVKQLIFRKILQWFSIEVVLYVFGYGIDQVLHEDIGQTIGFGLSILIIYIVASVISNLLNVREAQELTALFKDFQDKHENS